MAVAVALWSLAVKPDVSTLIEPPADIRITNIALGDEVADETGRTTVRLVYRTPGTGQDSDSEDEDEDEDDGDKEKGDDDNLTSTILCSLSCGKIEQAQVNIVLNEDSEYVVEVVGKNTVYLTGNYIDQRPPDQAPFSDEEEDEFDLQDVSSDVEVDPAELDGMSDGERFEEIVEEQPKAEEKSSKKRPRESDAMETDELKVSKSEKKKQKKLKGADGQAAEAPAEKAEKAEKGKKEKKEKGKDKAAEKAEKAERMVNGVKVVDTKIGTGPQAKRGNTVGMRYIGRLVGSQKPFDQNTKGTPFKFRLGAGEVIKGWDIGVAGMQVGGERILTIPAELAYGKKKMGGIPPNSTLVFEVKLVEIK